MVKTHKLSKIVRFHSQSEYANEILSPSRKNNTIVLQIENISCGKYDFIAEVINTNDYEKVEEATDNTKTD